MLIPLDVIESAIDLDVQAVLHVGAHRGEERAAYRAAGYDHIAWVEADPTLAEQLRAEIGPHERVYEGAAWSVGGETLNFHQTSDTQSSSIFPLAEHRISYPHIHETATIEVTTVTLDQVLADYSRRMRRECDFINLDIQGAEYQALLGVREHLPSVRWVYTEVSDRELYAGQRLRPEVTALLVEAGFSVVAERQAVGYGWGDVLFASEEVKGALGPLRWRMLQARLRSVIAVQDAVARLRGIAHQALRQSRAIDGGRP